MNEREFEDLVEAALDPGAAVPHAGRDDKLRDLRDFAARARAATVEPVASAAAWSEMRESALVGRILGRTTREDLSWRGELRVVGSFVRERLSASPLLRFVAASLALHVAAVPVLAAWYAFERDDQPGLQLSFEPAVSDAPFDDAVEVVDAPVAPVDATFGGLSSDAIENATRRARFVLSRAFGGRATPADQGAAGESPDPSVALERNLLAARSRLLAERAWSDWLDETERWDEATTLARVLWVETLLDRLALDGIRSPRLGPCLNDLSLLGLADESSAMHALVGLTLDRARSYGAWSASPDFEPAAVQLPLSAAWFAALEAAAPTAFVGDPVWDSFRTAIR